jgi:hypothetical protein
LEADALEDLSDEEDPGDLSDEMDDIDGFTLRKHGDPVTRKANRVKTVSWVFPDHAVLIAWNLIESLLIQMTMGCLL